MSGKLIGAGLTPYEIYEQLRGGPGSDRLDTAQHTTRSEWEHEDERAQMISKLGEKIRIGWQGEASDAAFGAALPLAESAIRGSDHLNTAQDLLSRQSGSFHDAFNSVRPVPARPPDNNVLNESIPFETDLDREIKTYQADAQHNLDVYRGYDNASEYNETNMPREYSTITHSGGTITVKPRGGDTGGDTGEPGDGSRERAPGGGEPGSFGGPPGGGAPGGSPAGGPVPGGAPVGGPAFGGQQTSPSDVRPGPGGGGFPQSPAASGAPGGGTAPPGGFLPGGGFPGGPGGSSGSGGFGGRGGGGSTGGFGGRGGAPGGSGGAGGPGARGAVPGAGAGALAAEEAAVRRGGLAASGARGAGGMPMGGMGAGQGKGDEDDEHERKIMIESGGEDVFGSDVLTAPQVIGEDEYED
jgi:hypothetical protein